MRDAVTQDNNVIYEQCINYNAIYEQCKPKL